MKSRKLAFKSCSFCMVVSLFYYRTNSLYQDYIILVCINAKFNTRPKLPRRVVRHEGPGVNIHTLDNIPPPPDSLRKIFAFSGKFPQVINFSRFSIDYRCYQIVTLFGSNVVLLKLTLFQGLQIINHYL